MQPSASKRGGSSNHTRLPNAAFLEDWSGTYVGIFVLQTQLLQFLKPCKYSTFAHLALWLQALSRICRQTQLAL